MIHAIFQMHGNVDKINFALRRACSQPAQHRRAVCYQKRYACQNLILVEIWAREFKNDLDLPGRIEIDANDSTKLVDKAIFCD
ncbi:hypothetical protein AU255_08425 [Methyloprofundus sedimenti]|uniref:Uncharacterized protein n=1 Tax=Methyloprofundus sedimenti TaxID=1420851 RepID=A0A1V8M8H6_9GAMM|nr:hypothetical protein AU255_08425 [Methyloprofundus sedimenti]